mgnify:CR=1 FL=1
MKLFEAGDHVVNRRTGQRGLVVHQTERSLAVIVARPYQIGRLVYEILPLDKHWDRIPDRT